MLKFAIYNSLRCLLPSALRSISTVTVVGAGLMGSGIAQVCAQSQYNVRLIDIDESRLTKAKHSITRNLDRVMKKKYKEKPLQAQDEKDSVLSRISFLADVKHGCTTTDLVIEAIVEDLNPKTKFFRNLDELAHESCIFASNTSSLSVDDIAEATSRKDRFAGLHFFSPVPIMELVEVVRGSNTSDSTFNTLMKFGKSLGKTVVACRDTPGFIVNRLLVPYLLEAVRMVERGDASRADIDQAMRLGAAHPMGPLELADFVGLDIVHHIASGWASRFPEDPLFAVPSILDKLVSEGHLGRKTGKGFFDYGDI